MTSNQPAGGAAERPGSAEPAGLPDPGTTEPVGPELSGRADRREHGGMPPRMDDDDLQLRTERDRVEAGLQDYVPDDVPPATDSDPVVDVTDTEQYRQELAEIRHQQRAGEMRPLSEDRPFPPTRYEEQPETD